MATVTLLAKARQRRLNAVASLKTGPQKHYKDNVVSIFDYAFDEETPAAATESNVIAFRSSRKALVGANDQQMPARVAA